MIRKDVELAEGWMGLEHFVVLLQNSVRQADTLLAKEPSGEFQYAITEISLSAPVEIQVEAKTSQPLVRIPLQEELARSGVQVARLSFSLRPVPIEGVPGTAGTGGPSGATALPDRLEKLRVALADEDYRDRLRALKEVEALGAEARPLLATVMEMARSDRSGVVRAAAESVQEKLVG